MLMGSKMINKNEVRTVMNHDIDTFVKCDNVVRMFKSQQTT